MREIADGGGRVEAAAVPLLPFEDRPLQGRGGGEGARSPGGDRAERRGHAVRAARASLDAYLAWIEANADLWSKLMQSAAALPEARELVEGFRERTMDLVLTS